MQIKNNTNRTLDIVVAGQSSQTLWTTQLPAGQSVGKDLSDSDKPFTVTGRWAADPALQYNWLVGNGVGSVPNNNVTITVNLAYPAFNSSQG